VKREQEREHLHCSDPEIGDLFIFYVSGKVTPVERRRIEEHLRVGPECQEELRFFRELKKAEKELFVDA
jgi:anti-sigma factor RsiW